MKTGITTSSYYSWDHPAEGLAHIRQHGYDCADYQKMINTENQLHENDRIFEERLKEEAALAKSLGLWFNQAHGPWRYPPCDYKKEDREERFDKMARSLHGASLLGSSYLVIHPLMPFGTDSDPQPEELYRINFDYYTRLSKVAHEENVVLCLENMPFPAMSLARPSEILALVKDINSPYLKICLDTGHCAVCDIDAGEAVRTIGKDWLAALHVHDNDGKGDQHRMPYHGSIDWESFTSALAEIGFDGVMSLETAAPLNLPEPLLEYERIGLAKTARYLADKATEKKN